MTDLTPARVAEIAAKATPGPWVWEDLELLNPAREQRVISSYPYEGQYIDPQGTDADFITAAHGMAALIATQEAEIERLREAEDRLFDVLLVDDGQAHKEGRRYLQQNRPDLFQALEAENDRRQTG